MNSSGGNEKIAFFVYYGWLSISPSLVSALKLLNEKGFSVDVIYLYDEKFGYYEHNLKNVRLFPVRPYQYKFLHPLQFFISCFNIVKSNKYKFYVGIDQEGVITAGILAKLRRVPFIYYSLEILTKEDISKKRSLVKVYWSAKKILESYFSKKAYFIITQDKYRAQMLVKENNLNQKKICIVPNSYYFDHQAVNFAIQNLGIPSDKKIIIYTGSANVIMALKEIVAHVDLWPDNAVFLLHSPYSTLYLEEVEKFIGQNNLKDKVFISVKRLTFDELCGLINKADIGIAFYNPLIKNCEVATSGKVSFYLSQGKPIITNSFTPKSEEIISKYKCGVSIKSAEEAGNAIRTILDNYAEFSNNSRTVYEKELDFSRHFNEVLGNID